MKFGLYLLENMVSEWHSFYMNYHKLKKLLKVFKKNWKKTSPKNEKESFIFQKSHGKESFLTIKEKPSEKEAKETGKNQISFTQLKIKFYSQLCYELSKVNFFFNKNIEFYETKLKKIEKHLSALSKYDSLNYMKKKYEDAIIELYKEIDYLSKYLDLNTEAKRKIMKKFNKYNQAPAQENQSTNVNNRNKSTLEQEKEIKDMINYIDVTVVKTDSDKITKIEADIEKMFKKFFYYKYSFNAVKMLKESRAAILIKQKYAFTFGFFIGILLIIFILCILIGNHFHIDMDDDAKFKTIFPMFRGYLVMVLYYWFLGLNVYVWNKYHINYKLAFNFDSHYSPVISIFKRAAFFSMIVSLMLLCYMIERTQIPVLYDIISFIPLELTPLISYIFVFIYLLTPLQIFNYHGRLYLGKLFYETMASITTTSELRHTWLGDQMTSLVGPFRDIEYTACFYVHYNNTFEEKKRLCSNRRPIVILIGIYPYFIRFLQVIKTMYEKKIIFPDILNAIKYTLSILVAISSYYSKTIDFFNRTWLLIATFSSCWSYCWDMKMDYGLLQYGSPYLFLRSDIFYKRTWIYYTAMFLNFLGRFAWVLTISPDIVYRWIRPEFFLMVIYMIEMCRRGMWNFFRIELRHIDLCKNFQVSDKIKLPSYAKIKELIEQEEKKSGVQRKKERKLSLARSSFNSQGVNIDEQTNTKELKEYLEKYKKDTTQNENNENIYFKIEPKD